MTADRRLLVAETVRTARGIPGNAILIEDGRVVAVGDHRTLGGPGVTVEEYAGAHLIPGLRDAHMHPVTYAASLSGPSLTTVTNIGELQDAIRIAATDLASDEPLIALRLDDEALAASDCVLIATDHSSYDFGRIVAQAPLIVDTRNASGPFLASDPSLAAKIQRI